MDYSKELKESVKLSDSMVKIKEYYEKHYGWIFVNILIILASSLLGLKITGVLGAIIGFVIGILSFIFLPQSISKIKEIYK